MSPVKLFAQFRDLPRESLFDGKFERCAVRSDGAMSVFNWLKPGLPDFPPHDHPFDQLVFIFEGTMELTVGDVPYLLTPGSVLRIPAGVPHKARVVGEETVLNIDIFSPVREDYAQLLRNPPDEYGPTSADAGEAQ
ncbi:cupin domain-containing protein [Variovorax sp. J22P271]|uniref:cupin domain-containing protein n=1 Tax=Variovorax davisae TaxID=3053515 RepID=UPI0025749D90|nr:cupin domain-containing protein [Variovorax sp. J22P271]MDM0032417.1 cupin domain-containing protein [Variovorax sp. J22P271]